MLQEGNYNILEIYPPTQGMNRLIAPEALPQGFAVALENILPTPLGSATVRYGTRRLEGMTLEPDDVILEAFPFVKPNGDKQAVLYVQTFVLDETARNFVVLNPQSFQFDTDKAIAFQADTPLKIEYTHAGIQPFTQRLWAKLLLARLWPSPLKTVFVKKVVASFFKQLA